MVAQFRTDDLPAKQLNLERPTGSDEQTLPFSPTPLLRHCLVRVSEVIQQLLQFATGGAVMILTKHEYVGLVCLDGLENGLKAFAAALHDVPGENAHTII